MKTILKLQIFILFLLLTGTLYSQSTNSPCCPDFTLKITTDMCVPIDTNRLTSKSQGAGSTSQNPHSDVERESEGSYCQNGTYTYVVTPNLGGYSYTWVVSGGTLNSGNGTSVGTITWGTGETGTIDVVVQNIADPNCITRIKKTVKLRPGPTAFFISNVTSACVGQLISFTNQSVGGASYVWNFGDGTGSQLSGFASSPLQHSYSSAGTYIVTLTVSNLGDVSIININGKKDTTRICPCTSVYTTTITINSSQALSITTDCKKMLCSGDKATYCAVGTNSPSWTAVGGTILSTNGNCVEVNWNPTDSGPQPTISFTSSSSSGNCGNNASLIVPVLYQGIPISGNTIPCINSSETYSIPTLPGTIIKWSISPANAAILTPSLNNEQVTIKWNQSQVSPFTLTCEYENPITCCKGTTTLKVYVKSKFGIYGLASSCVSCTTSHNTSGPAQWWLNGMSVGTISNTYTQTWLAPGTYTLTAKPTVGTDFCNPNGESKTITVYPKPILTNKAGKRVICPGSTEMYSIETDTPKDIVWTVSPSGSTIITTGINNDSCQVTFVGTGPWVVTASQLCVANCAISTDTMRVSAIPVPGAISGPNSACMDAVATYTVANYIAGTDYQWSISPAAVGTVVSGQGGGSVGILWHGSSTSPNNCQISVTNCSGTSPSFTVSIYTPSPLIITSSAVNCCNTQLSATTGFSTYTWTYNGSPVGSNSSTISVLNSNPGTYSLVATSSNSCPRNAEFLVEPSTYNTKIYSAGPFHYCQNQSISTAFTSHVAGCSGTYQWLKNGSPISGATMGTYTATSVGTYNMIFTPNGCSPITTEAYSISVEPCPGGCGLPNLGNLQIGPNGVLCNPPTFTSSITQTTSSYTYSGVTWNFGDGSPLGSGANPTHSYDTIGVFHVWAGVNVSSGGNNCLIWDSVYVTIPAAADFDITRGNNCEKILKDMSKVISGTSIANYSWSATPSGATFTNPTAANTTISGMPGIYFVTLTITTSNPSCTVSKTKKVVLSGVGNQTIQPTEGCLNKEFDFTATPAGVGLKYKWNFGDGFLSELPNPKHIYASATTYPCTLNVTDQEGCTAQYQQNITVKPLPVCTVSPTSVQICSGSSTNLTVNPTPSNCSVQWWKIDQTPTQLLAQNVINVTTFGSYYAVVTNPTTGCSVNSDTALVLLKQKPKAKIIGQSTVCYSGNTVNFNLASSYCEFGQNVPPNLLFTWLPVSGVTYGTSNGCSTNVTINNPNAGPYSVVLEVKDITTGNGCSAYDTICVFPVQSPTVLISGGGVCENPSGITLNAYANGTGLLTYLWNTGATTASISALSSGIYSVIVTNTNGCNATATTEIKPLPDISLFPKGCDTLRCPPRCASNDTLRVPLPLNPPASVSSYTVKWFDNGNPLGAPYNNSPFLLLRNNSQLNPPTGLHNLNVVVTGSNGCSVTSEVYELFIQSCDTCGCDSSKFVRLGYALNPELIKQKSDLESDEIETGKITTDPNKTGSLVIPNNQLTTGKIDKNFQPFKNGSTIPYKNFQPFKNGSTIPSSDCTPITFQAMFMCPSKCSTSVVSGVLTNSAGQVVQTVASMPYTFTPTPGMNDVYTLTLYGACGAKKCDSVKVKIPINCPKVEPCSICPKEFNEKLEIKVSPKALKLIQLGNNRIMDVEIPVSINAGTIPLTQVTASIESVTLSEINAECIQCDNMPAGWYSLAGKDLTTNSGSVPGSNIGYDQDPVSTNNTYMNPREWDWSSQSAFTLNSGQTDLHVYLPAYAQLSCCPIGGNICIRFTFRDVNCKVCEKVICFRFGKKIQDDSDLKSDLELK